MWTRFCLRVLSASVFLKPLAEASSWQQTPLVNSTTWTAPFSTQEEAASGTRASVASSTGDGGEYTRASSDAAPDSWSGSVTVPCSGSGDTRPCSLSQPMATASPPAFQSESATPSSSANGQPGILTETAAQVGGAAAPSASPALSIIPADPSITLALPDFATEPLHFTLDSQPPLISPAAPSAPPVLPVAPGRLNLTDSVLSSLVSVVNPSALAPSSSPRISLEPTRPVDQSPPQTPEPLPIAGTATPSSFASASVVKSAAEASTADGFEFDPSTSLTAAITSSLPPHASDLSHSTPGNGVVTPPANFSLSSNTTFAAVTTPVMTPSMSVSFYSNSVGSPSFPTAFTTPVINPSASTLSPSMPDNTISPTSTTTPAAFFPESISVFVCGGSPFRPSEYTCYDDSTLCPVENGARLESCGGSCYNPGLYGCVDNGLQPIISGTLPGGAIPSRTTAVPVTQWPSGLSTPSLSATPTSSRPKSSSITSSLSTLSTSATSSSPSSTSSSASASSTAAPNPSNDDNLSTNQIAAIAASTSAAVVLFVLAGVMLFRRQQYKRANPAQQVYPEIAYLYDPPVPGSSHGSRSAIGGPNSNPNGGSGSAVGPFGIGGVGGAQSARGPDSGAGSAAGWTGATLSALGATLRGGGRAASTHSSSSNGSAVSLVGPAGRPPVMGFARNNGSNGSGSGSSNAALLAASTRKSGSGTPTRGAGDGNTLAPPPSRENKEAGEEARPFLGSAGTAASSRASSRERSVERGADAAQGQQREREEVGLWDEIDRDSAEREHERQVEETRQRRELARAFLLQAKERQELRVPLANRDAGESSSSGAGAAAAAGGIGGVALAGAAAAASIRGQQRQSNPKVQHTQQWWQYSPSRSPAPGPPPPSPPSPPPVAHANTPAYQPIYPPISPTFPASGPILTSQHIEQERLQEAQHAHAAARAASPTHPSLHRTSPSYPPPSFSQAQQNASHQFSNGRSTSPYNSGYSTAAGGRPFFHQNTSYSPPQRTYSGGSSNSNSINNGARSFSGSSYSQYSPGSNGGGPRRGSNGSVHNTNVVGGVYTTIPEEDQHQQQQQQQQQPAQQRRQRQQSLSMIMRQMNALDEEDSADEGQGFLQAPRRVLSVRNGAVTPSSDGDESTDERDVGAAARRRGMI